MDLTGVTTNPCTLLKMKLQSVPQSLQLVSVLETDLKTISRCYVSYSNLYGMPYTHILDSLTTLCPPFRELMFAAFCTYIKFLHGDGSTEIAPLVGDAYWMMTPFLYLEGCAIIVGDGEARSALTMLKADVQRLIHAYKKFSTALEAGRVDTISTNPDLSAFVIRTIRDVRVFYRPFDVLMRGVEQFADKYNVPDVVHFIGDVELLGLSEQRPPIGSDQCDLPTHFLSTLTDWPLWARLSDGRQLGCDLIIDASGVVPNSQLWKRNCPDLSIAEDCGILVNEQMIKLSGQMWRTCSLRAMFAHQVGEQFICTGSSFFGYKIVLLGDFAGDRLTKPFENNYRITEGHEYVKVLTKDHHVHGAVLIGETDLEEAIENLILNQTDISQIEQQLLDPDIDLEDFFD